MVDVREEREKEKRIGRGFRLSNGGKTSTVWFNNELHEQIRKEAVSRGWPFSRMVRFLCSASIGGVE